MSFEKFQNLNQFASPTLQHTTSTINYVYLIITFIPSLYKSLPYELQVQSTPLLHVSCMLLYGRTALRNIGAKKHQSIMKGCANSLDTATITTPFSLTNNLSHGNEWDKRHDTSKR